MSKKKKACLEHSTGEQVRLETGEHKKKHAKKVRLFTFVDAVRFTTLGAIV